MEELEKQIRTGDLILFDSQNTGIFRLFDIAIKFFTGSDYNHIAMVLVNPTFMAKTANLPIENFTGYFVWESSWEGEADPQDGKIKLGVQLTPLEEVIKRLESNDRIAITDKINSNEVFSFGRDYGHYGRILNQAVVAKSSLSVRNGNEIMGYCFTPQDGNSLLSSLAITEWFLYPNSYEDKIQCLKPLFFDEV